jgi:hypothetical protein
LGNSPKQLTHRISVWGLEKNVKRDERQSFIKGLKALRLNASTYKTKVVRGRRLGKAKLKRWMRESPSAMPVGQLGCEDAAACLEEHNSKSSQLIDTMKELC